MDTTSTQGEYSEIVQLACCDVHVCETAPKRVDDGGRAASVVSSRGVCGGVVGVRFTFSVPSLCDVRFDSPSFLVQVNCC